MSPPEHGGDTLPPDSTLGQALQWARARIGMVEARILLRHRLACPAATLIAHPERRLGPAEQADFVEWVRRRLAGEPVAYLTGEREFYGRRFMVSPAVLIPRPETELLVELALARLLEHPAPRLLDLGTGSGAIAITLALELGRHADVIAADISRKALWMAMSNAAALGASLSFVESDWFSQIDDEPFDLIVANPPYVAAHDPHLDDGDVRFEPRGALVGGPDGLDGLHGIIDRAGRHLRPGGWLLLEHGFDQAAAVRQRLLEAGFGHVASWTDLAGIERASGGERLIR